MHRIAFCQTNRLFIFLLERAETEIRFSMANGTFKMKMDINRHSPRLMPNNGKNLNPPFFWLPTTFKSGKNVGQHVHWLMLSLPACLEPSVLEPVRQLGQEGVPQVHYIAPTSTIYFFIFQFSLQNKKKPNNIIC